MSGYEYVDGDGDKIEFSSTDARVVRRDGIIVSFSPNDTESEDTPAVLVPADKGPEFLAGIAKVMGLRAVYYAGQDEIGSPADFPERQVGNLMFRIDGTRTQIAARRSPARVTVGMLEGWEQAQTAGTILLAMSAVLKADLDKKIEEKARQTKLVSDLAEAIMRGDLSHMTRNMALRAAREVLDQGWTVTPPAGDKPAFD